METRRSFNPKRQATAIARERFTQRTVDQPGAPQASKETASPAFAYGFGLNDDVSFKTARNSRSKLDALGGTTYAALAIQTRETMLPCLGRLPSGRKL